MCHFPNYNYIINVHRRHGVRLMVHWCERHVNLMLYLDRDEEKEITQLKYRSITESQNLQNLFETKNDRKISKLLQCTSGNAYKMFLESKWLPFTDMISSFEWLNIITFEWHYDNNVIRLSYYINRIHIISDENPGKFTASLFQQNRHFFLQKIETENQQTQ